MCGLTPALSPKLPGSRLVRCIPILREPPAVALGGGQTESPGSAVVPAA